MSDRDTARRLTPTAHRALREHALSLLRILDAAPPDLSDGDREVAGLLLPAWHATYGASKCQVAHLRQPDANTPLSDVAALWTARGFKSPLAASHALGKLLDRLAGHAVAGFIVVKHPGDGNQALWVCKPL